MSHFRGVQACDISFLALDPADIAAIQVSQFRQFSCEMPR
jgi:hypothetical protein